MKPIDTSAIRERLKEANDKEGFQWLNLDPDGAFIDERISQIIESDALALLEEVETLRAAVIATAEALEAMKHTWDSYLTSSEKYPAYHKAEAALKLPAVVALRTEKTS